jgi:pimeloyl-ACP methyl ester carboxylesterase
MEIIRTKSFELAAISRGDKNAKRFALLLPGRLDTKDYASFTSHVEYLAARGFFAVAFDPPGTWESPGTTELFTTTNYIKAVNEIIEHFGNRPTLLLGHSRGGAVAILAGAANPAVVAIVAVMANFGSPNELAPDVVKRGYSVSHRDLPPGTSKTAEQKEFKLMLEYWTDGKRYDPEGTLKKCTKPKLVIYGTHDDFVSPDEVRKLLEGVPEPTMSKEINCDHDYRYSADAIKEVNEEVGKFIEKYL